MNKFNVIALSGLLSLSCLAALAESASLDQPTLRFIPVLVQVNAVGKVVNVSPSADLPRSLDRVLRNNLDEMISGPAILNGKAVPSQLVVNLELQTTPQTEGKYSAQFAYVSSAPVPAGSWYWAHTSGRRPILTERRSQFRGALETRRDFNIMGHEHLQTSMPTRPNTAGNH